MLSSKTHNTLNFNHMGKKRATSLSAINNIDQPITGIIDIDETINGLVQITTEEIEKIKPYIDAYLFGEQYIARIISEMTNIETAEFIEEMGIIIKQNEINNYEELKTFMDQCKKKIIDIDQCEKIDIII